MFVLPPWGVLCGSGAQSDVVGGACASICVVGWSLLRLVCAFWGLGVSAQRVAPMEGGGVPVSGGCALAMSGVPFRVLWVFCARSAGTLGAYFGSCAFIAGMLVGTCAASRVFVTGGAPG